VLTERWLGDWATRLQAAVDRALREVVSQFPFEASDHRVGPAVSATELGLLRRRVSWMPDDLIALHRHVGPVTLPDINNGFFLYPVDRLLDVLDQQGRPDRIGEPFTEHIDVIAFGSNGGGDLYAMAVTDGRVFRIQDASYVGGVYDGTNRGVTVVGTDLSDFLERLLDAVTGFAPNGDITDL
jgi:hypothetical protein